MATETRTSLLAFFGRVADGLTRRVLRPEEMFVSLQEGAHEALLKEDGHFAFYDVEPSLVAYHLRIGGPSYVTRVLTPSLPTISPVQVTLTGEDELYVALAGPPNAQNQVSFQPLSFVPPLRKGSVVVGPGAFTTTLAEPLEARDVGLASLTTSSGLAAGNVLRIVRGPNLLLRPGPYYPFPADMTVVAVRVVEDDPGEAAVSGATVRILQIDGASPTVSTVGGLPLSRFTLGAGAPAFVVLDDDDRVATSNDRGDAVFCFASSTTLASLRLEVTKSLYQSASVTFNVTTSARNFQKIPLTRI